MVGLTCYRVPERIGGERVVDFGGVVEKSDRAVGESGPVAGPGFTAMIYVVTARPHDPPWASFLREGFTDDLRLGNASSPAALLVVRVTVKRRKVMFAFPFGPAGRSLLRSDAIQRGYGLRTALNLIYRRSNSGGDVARLRSLDSKQRGTTTMRRRTQASDLSSFEVFGVNQLRDVVNAATGTPVDDAAWGRRVTGADALSLSLPITFNEMGSLCKSIEAAHTLDDYQDNFAWIDNIRPVADPIRRKQLEDEVLRSLRDDDGAGLALACPEIIDWERVDGFHYHFDRRRSRTATAVVRPELRLEDLLNGMSDDDRADLGSAYVRQRQIKALDGNGSAVYHWSIWRCLVGELKHGTETFVLDEGEFYSIRPEYLSELDAFIDGLPTSFVQLPTTTATTHEGDYNEATAAASSDRLLLLDRKTVRLTGRTTPIEICDLLSDERHLVHVKRHLSSSSLSHLFAQGLTSAELLQSNPAFREKAREKVLEAAAGATTFNFFDNEIRPADFEVVYAIAADWAGRSRASALPFFSKVNLRNAANELATRGFRIALDQISYH